jgi:hypothetical protein
VGTAFSRLHGLELSAAEIARLLDRMLSAFEDVD